MKIQLLIIFILIPLFAKSQLSENKWIDRINLEIGLNYGKRSIIYWSQSKPSSGYQKEIVNRRIYFLYMKLLYRNKYFLSGLESYYIINNIKAGMNILYFIPEAESMGQYVGPSLRLGYNYNFYREQINPIYGIGLDIYYKNIYLGCSKQFLIGETKFGNSISKESFLFVNIGYSFKIYTFKKK